MSAFGLHDGVAQDLPALENWSDACSSLSVLEDPKKEKPPPTEASVFRAAASSEAMVIVGSDVVVGRAYGGMELVGAVRR
jgi:hypothetical protein